MPRESNQKASPLFSCRPAAGAAPEPRPVLPDPSRAGTHLLLRAPPVPGGRRPRFPLAFPKRRRELRRRAHGCSAPSGIDRSPRSRLPGRDGAVTGSGGAAAEEGRTEGGRRRGSRGRPLAAAPRWGWGARGGEPPAAGSRLGPGRRLQRVGADKKPPRAPDF